MRAFTLHQLIRINDLIRIKLNHLLEVVSHRFSLLRVLIASVDATGDSQRPLNETTGLLYNTNFSRGVNFRYFREF